MGVQFFTGKMVAGRHVLGGDAHVIVVKASQRPSLIISSTSLTSPMRLPQRAEGMTEEARDMFSMPPATTQRASPARMASAASYVMPSARWGSRMGDVKLVDEMIRDEMCIRDRFNSISI